MHAHMIKLKFMKYPAIHTKNHSCQHQRTKKRDRQDEKAWKAVVSIFPPPGGATGTVVHHIFFASNPNSRQRPSAGWAWQWISRPLHIVSSAVADTKMRIACYTARLRCTLVAGPNSGECPCPFAIEYRPLQTPPLNCRCFFAPYLHSSFVNRFAIFTMQFSPTVCTDATLSCARENNQLGG